MKFTQLHEDSKDAGYPHELRTPRELGYKDYIFVAGNAEREVGSEVIKFDGSVLHNSKILKNTPMIFQYSHVESEENEVHIESVEMYRNIWLSIHIPAQSAKFIGTLK